MRRKIVFGILVTLLILVVLYREMISYGIMQARGQLKIIRDAQPLSEVLEDTLIADSVKLKIQLIMDVKEFAVNEIGLKSSENYSTFYDQEGKVLLWNLSACEPFSLSPYEWSFPFLGSFPYKGFFDLEKAKAEQELLMQAGLDTRIRPVGGWSTLGWTKDPILSNMVERPTGSIVELIIHELTHATLFVKDHIEFNENLASFIGEQGAMLYLSKEYGENSDQLFEYILAEEDHKRFRDHMLLATTKLDSLYMSFPEGVLDAHKLEAKTIFIEEIVNSLDTLHFHNPRYYSIFNKSHLNNAYFMSYLRYYSAGDSLSNLYKNTYSEDLRLFIEGMKAFHSN